MYVAKKGAKFRKKKFSDYSRNFEVPKILKCNFDDGHISQYYRLNAKSKEGILLSKTEKKFGGKEGRN